MTTQDHIRETDRPDHGTRTTPVLRGSRSAAADVQTPGDGPSPATHRDQAAAAAEGRASRQASRPAMTVDDVLAVFRRVLETPDITADSDFFDLGGDSLLATRILSAVAKATGLEPTFDDFLLSPTPVALAALIAGGDAP
jgi:acyl carrier protein